MSICSFVTGKCRRVSRVGVPSVDLQEDIHQQVNCEQIFLVWQLTYQSYIVIQYHQVGVVDLRI